MKTEAGQNGLLDFSFKPHALIAEVPDIYLCDRTLSILAVGRDAPSV